MEWTKRILAIVFATLIAVGTYPPGQASAEETSCSTTPPDGAPAVTVSGTGVWANTNDIGYQGPQGAYTTVSIEEATLQSRDASDQNVVYVSPDRQCAIVLGSSIGEAPEAGADTGGTDDTCNGDPCEPGTTPLYGVPLGALLIARRGVTTYYAGTTDGTGISYSGNGACFALAAGTYDTGARVWTGMGGAEEASRCGFVPPPPQSWLPAQATGDEQLPHGLRTWRGRSTMVGGSATYSEGEYIYQDYVFDDYGAAVPWGRPPEATPLQPSKGTYRYPTDPRFGNNAADILQVRAAADASTVWFLVWLNTLKEADTTIATIALDTDGNPATGVGDWGYGSKVVTPGVDHVITITPAGAFLDGTTALPFSIDTGTNALEVAVPRGIGSSSSWRAWAATGLSDAATGGYMSVPTVAPTTDRPGYGDNDAPPLFNVAFRFSEGGNWWEDEQAIALRAPALPGSDLLGGARIGDFSATLNLDRLASGDSDPPVPLEPGLHEVVFRSSFAIPPFLEGMSVEGIEGRAGERSLAGKPFQFFGPYQPYAISVPSSPVLGITLVLHGGLSNHTNMIRRDPFRAIMSDGPGNVAVAPLGRGGGSFWTDFGEKDALEALADARSRFQIAPERTYVVGYSMGSYGVYRLTTLYPDAFARGAMIAGVTGDGNGYLRQQPYPEGDLTESLTNLRAVPLLVMQGTNDEIDNYMIAQRVHRILQDARIPHHLYSYPGHDHLSLAELDAWGPWATWLAGAEIEPRPARVRYRVSPVWGNPNLGLAHERAYWIEGMVVRDQSLGEFAIGGVDALSYKTGNGLPRVIDVTGFGNDPTPYLDEGVDVNGVHALTDKNTLEIKLDNVARVVVDAARAGLDPSSPLEVKLKTDGPSTLVIRWIDGNEDVISTMHGTRHLVILP